MRVLVTGGAGFIGSHLVDLLVANGAEVRVLDNLSAAGHGGPDHINPAADYRFVDCRDRDAVGDAVKGVDAVSHQAARVGMGRGLDDALEYVRDNDEATAVLLRELSVSRFAGRLVLASSMVVYGEGIYRCPRHGLVPPGPRHPARLAAGDFEPPCSVCGGSVRPDLTSEDAPLRPSSVYAATKVHQEHLAGVYARETGVPVTSLRYHNVYGPRFPRGTPYAGVASVFLTALAAGRAPTVLEDGGQRRDFVHVTDVARANLAALTVEPPVNGPVNVASGAAHTVGELAAALVAGVGPAAPPPLVTGRWRPGDVRHVTASHERAMRLLGFRARVPFDQGVAELASETGAGTPPRSTGSVLPGGRGARQRDQAFRGDPG
ncbi:MAG: NAD-dependent epimerase/dehydratase family protein [Acidimicrobiales bacterium]